MMEKFTHDIWLGPTIFSPLLPLTGWRKKIARYALEGLPKGRLLDVGCGTGYLLSLAKSFGYSVCGVDPSHGMLEKAKAQGIFQPHELFLTPVDQLPFENESFDIVIASGSLVHVPKLKEGALEISRVLRRGGRLRIIDHAVPMEPTWSTPLLTLFSQASGDILHDYPAYFSESCKLIARKTLGRGGYMQRFDFERG